MHKQIVGAGDAENKIISAQSRQRTDKEHADEPNVFSLSLVNVTERQLKN